jgi:hypothetical protein
MTDTLRADCEALLVRLTMDDTDRSCCLTSESTIPTLMAFARAHQAKGLREAAELANGWVEGQLIANDILLAARALEKRKP